MRTILIDGDLIAFTVAARVETKIAWGEGVDTREADLADAIRETIAWVGELKSMLEADVAIMAVGDPSRRYFRHDIYPDYKLDRTHGEPPLLLKAMKSFLQDESHKEAEVAFTPKMKPGLEADDVLGILGSHPTMIAGEKVIVTADKDLRQIAGKHFNPRKPHDGVVVVTPEEADDWFYTQVLTGDTCDGFPGCPGVGPVKAKKIIEQAHSDAYTAKVSFDSVVWPMIVAAYAKKRRDEQYAITQARVARILRYTDYDFPNKVPKLWLPTMR